MTFARFIRPKKIADSDSSGGEALTPASTPDASDKYVVNGTEEHSYSASDLISEKTRDTGTIVRVFRVGDDKIAKVYTTPKGRVTSCAALAESMALNKLTEAGCEYAPRLLDYSTGRLAGLSNGGVSYGILMTRVPGVPLDDFWHALPVPERDAVMLTLYPTLCAILKCGVDNNSLHNGNIIYDVSKNKSYIVDYERAVFAGEPPGEMNECFNKWRQRWEEKMKSG